MLTDSHSLFVLSIQKPKCKNSYLAFYQCVCVCQSLHNLAFFILKFLHQSKYTQDLTADKWVIELMDFLNEVSLKA